MLYTDGVTEAANLEDELYGLERLCTLLSQYWENSVEQIKQIVLDDIQMHIGEQKLYDDLTLVIVKQTA